MKTAISVPDAVFARVDRGAKHLGVSRSEFFSRAAEHYLDDLDREGLTARIDAALSRVGEPGAEDSTWRRAGLASLLAATDGDEW